MRYLSLYLSALPRVSIKAQGLHYHLWRGMSWRRLQITSIIDIRDMKPTSNDTQWYDKTMLNEFGVGHIRGWRNVDLIAWEQTFLYGGVSLLIILQFSFLAAFPLIRSAHNIMYAELRDERSANFNTGCGKGTWEAVASRWWEDGLENVQPGSDHTVLGRDREGKWWS